MGTAADDPDCCGGAQLVFTSVFELAAFLGWHSWRGEGWGRKAGGRVLGRRYFSRTSLFIFIWEPRLTRPSLTASVQLGPRISHVTRLPPLVSLISLFRLLPAFPFRFIPSSPFEPLHTHFLTPRLCRPHPIPIDTAWGGGG